MQGDPLAAKRQELAQLTQQLDAQLAQGLVARMKHASWYLTGVQIGLQSLQAYYEEMGKFNEREKLIYAYIAMENRPMTDREVKEGLFGVMSDMNKVKPRITELKKRGWLVEAGKIKDHVTGKKVRLVKHVTPEERAKNED